MDRGTESSRELRQKIRDYDLVLRFPNTFLLFITTSQDLTRLASLAKLSAYPERIYLTEYQANCMHHFYKDEIWLTEGPERQSLLSIFDGLRFQAA